jgi:LPS export ABC transporter protein LptC
MNSSKLLLTSLILLFFFGACQIDYDLAGGEDDETQPDILMEGVVQIQKDSNSRILLKADRAAFFTSKGETVFDSMEFLDYGEGESLLRKGSAGKAVLYDNNDARLSGGVLIESFEDELRIEGDVFDWKDDSSQLSSPPGRKVSLIQKGEREIKGSQLTADFNLNEITFDEPVRGMVVINE